MFLWLVPNHWWVKTTYRYSRQHFTNWCDSTASKNTHLQRLCMCMVHTGIVDCTQRPKNGQTKTFFQNPKLFFCPSSSWLFSLFQCEKTIFISLFDMFCIKSDFVIQKVDQSSFSPCFEENIHNIKKTPFIRQIFNDNWSSGKYTHNLSVFVRHMFCSILVVWFVDSLIRMFCHLGVLNLGMFWVYWFFNELMKPSETWVTYSICVLVYWCVWMMSPFRDDVFCWLILCLVYKWGGWDGRSWLSRAYL